MRKRHAIFAFSPILSIFIILGVSDPARTVSVSQGTNINLTASPDHKAIVMDLQGMLWSLPITGGVAKRLTDPFLEATQPNWSPKGDLIAFQAYKGGTFHIWLMKPDGSGLRQLTDGHGDDREPRFSPDGTKIAFSSDRAFRGNYDIWVVNVADGRLTQWTSEPTEEFEPAWSPDGKEIAFVVGTSSLDWLGVFQGSVGGIIKSNSASGERRTIITAPQGAHLDSPSWSPDGQKIAYTEFSGRRTHLLVSGEQVGSAEDVFPFPAVWLSANQLLYTGDGKVLVSTMGGETKSIPFKADFLLDRPPYKHRQLDFDSSEVRPVKGIMEPVLSPDGKRIAFEALNQLWLMDIGDKPQPLTNDDFYKQSPAWSPDGTKIAYSSDKGGTANIYVLDLAAKTERCVTNLEDSAAFEPAWSPDGSKIAFQDQRGATYIVELASGKMTEAIPPGSFKPSKPSWSKNRNTLAMAVLRPYSRRFREGTNVIKTVDLTTRKVVLTEPAPFRTISTRGVDGPVYSPDGSQMAFVMGGHLWMRPVDADGIPAGEARQINHERTDAPSWSGDGKHLLYLSNGKLRLIPAGGVAPPQDVQLDLTWRPQFPSKTYIIHAGRLWDGLGPNERTNVDITVVGRRIQKIEPHTAALHRGAEVIDASGLTVMPGLWDAHVHEYGGLPRSGDRQGRIWLAYGFTTVQSHGDGAYEQMEIKESFGAGKRVGPRYFATGEIIDGERIYYPLHHGVYDEKELQAELERARALEYDNLKTYVRLSHEYQRKVMQFAHEQLGTWIGSHYGMPNLAFGMDEIAHLSSADTRTGYLYTMSYGALSYNDVRSLFIASGEAIASTPEAAAALYAEDPAIVDDPRLRALATPWELKSAMADRDGAVKEDQTTLLEDLRAEENTLQAVMHTGVPVLMGSDGGFPPFDQLLLRGEVKFGMKPWEALQTATLLPAKAFGYEKDLGSIEAGKLADIVIVAGDPLRDIKDAAKVQRVIVDGRVYTVPDLMGPFAGR
jgi:Tol biopolymer transport system component/cytosine/adenosine deaminase-related metal-dependent hydrolase